MTGVGALLATLLLQTPATAVRRLDGVHQPLAGEIGESGARARLVAILSPT